MTIGGWILIVLSWGAILGLAAFCFTMMMKKGRM